MRRIDSVSAYALLMLGVAALCGDFLLQGRVFSGVDLVNYFLPTAVFAGEWLKQGVLPLWNPMTFCGWPLVGDPQLRWFYPPNLLLLAIDQRTAFSVLMVADMAFGATGMWFYLRKAARVGPWPALCGAASLCLAGFFANHLMSGIVVFPATAAWVPWIMLLGWQLGRKGTGAKEVGWLGFAIGAQVLSGSPQIVFYTWITLVLQALWQIVSSAASTSVRLNSTRVGAVISRYAVAGALGIALGASSLIPSSEFGALSFQRGAKPSWESVTDCSLVPRFWWLLVAPKFYGDPKVEGIYWGGLEGYWDICGYSGIGPLVGLLLVLLSWRSLFGKAEYSSGEIHLECGGSTPPSPPRLDGAETLSLPPTFPLRKNDVFPTSSRPARQAVPEKAVSSRRTPKKCKTEMVGEAANCRPSPGSLAGFHLALAMLALFLAFGRVNPLYKVLYEWVPGFDRFRVPGRWLLFWQFGTATLFAMVLESLFGVRAGTVRLGKAAIPAAACFAFALALAALSSAELIRATDLDPSGGRFRDRFLVNGTAGSLWRAAALALGWTIVFGIAAKLNLRWRRAAYVLAAGLVLADVLTHGRGIVQTRTIAGQVQEFYPRSPLIQYLSANLGGTARYLATDSVGDWRNDQNQPELWANRSTLQGLHDARGYYPLCLKWFGQFVNGLCGRPTAFPMGGLLLIGEDLNPALLSMLNVRDLLSYENPRAQGLRLARQMDFGLRCYEVATMRGPAYLAKARPSGGMTDDEEMKALLAPGFDSRVYALASGAKPGGEGAAAAGGAASVEFARVSPTRMALNVEAGDNDLVVVSEAYHPGWRARVDGRPAGVVRANHALLGVYVPPGRHRIEVVFQPASFRLGLYASLAACGILAALLAARGGRGRKQAPGGGPGV